MMVRLFLSVALGSLFLLSSTTYAADSDKLVGVWKRVSAKNLDTGQESKNPGWLIVTKTHFSIVISFPDRKKVDKPLDEMTKEELRDRIRFLGNHGTYKVEGNKMIRRRVAASNPVIEGTDLVQEFRFEGDHVIFRFKNAVFGYNQETKLKRVE